MSVFIQTPKDPTCSAVRLFPISFLAIEDALQSLPIPSRPHESLDIFEGTNCAGGHLNDALTTASAKGWRGSKTMASAIECQRVAIPARVPKLLPDSHARSSQESSGTYGLLRRSLGGKRLCEIHTQRRFSSARDRSLFNSGPPCMPCQR